MTIALAYASDAHAAAAEVLPRRLETLPTLYGEGSLAELLSSRGVTSITGSVVPAGDGITAVARVELRAPLAGDGPDEETGMLEASSRLYDLVLRLVYARDLLWLTPGPPLPWATRLWPVGRSAPAVGTIGVHANGRSVTPAARDDG